MPVERHNARWQSSVFLKKYPNLCGSSLTEQFALCNYRQTLRPTYTNLNSSFLSFGCVYLFAIPCVGLM